MNPLAPLSSTPAATSLDDLIQSGLIPKITVTGVLLQGNELQTGQSRWRLGFERPLLMRLKSGPASVTGMPGIDPMPELSPRFHMGVTVMGPPGEGRTPPVPGSGWFFDDLVAQGYVDEMTLVGVLYAAVSRKDGWTAGTDLIVAGGPCYLDVQGFRMPLDLPADLAALVREGQTVEVTGRPAPVANIGGPDFVELRVTSLQLLKPAPPLNPSPVSPPKTAPPPWVPAPPPPAPAAPASMAKRRVSRVVLGVGVGVGLAGLGLGLMLWWRTGRS